MALHVPWVADTQHRAVAPTATVPITAAAQTRRQSSDSYKMDAAAVTPPQHRFQTACSPTQQGAAVGTPQHMMQRQRTGSQALPALEIRSPGGSSGFNPNPAWGRAATRSIAPSEVLGEGSMCGGSAGPGVSFSPGMLTAPVSGHATEGSHYPIGVLGTPTKVGWQIRTHDSLGFAVFPPRLCSATPHFSLPPAFFFRRSPPSASFYHSPSYT